MVGREFASALLPAQLCQYLPTTFPYVFHVQKLPCIPVFQEPLSTVVMSDESAREREAEEAAIEMFKIKKLIKHLEKAKG